MIAAAKVGGVIHPCATGSPLRHEGIKSAAAEGRLEGPRRRRKVGREGAAAHVGVAGTVHGDADAAVIATAAKVGGVDEHRINHQSLGPVIGGDLKADSVFPFEHVAASDFPSRAVDLLIDDGRTLKHLAPNGMKDEITLGIKGELVHALKGEPDGLWISTRRDDEVVLKLALVAVVDEVHAGINILVLHTGVGGDVR